MEQFRTKSGFPLTRGEVLERHLYLRVRVSVDRTVTEVSRTLRGGPRRTQDTSHLPNKHSDTTSARYYRALLLFVFYFYVIFTLI